MESQTASHDNALVAKWAEIPAVLKSNGKPSQKYGGYNSRGVLNLDWGAQKAWLVLSGVHKLLDMWIVCLYFPLKVTIFRSGDVVAIGWLNYQSEDGTVCFETLIQNQFISFKANNNQYV